MVTVVMLCWLLTKRTLVPTVTTNVRVVAILVVLMGILNYTVVQVGAQAIA